jgi:hypothetical protein
MKKLQRGSSKTNLLSPFSAISILYTSPETRIVFLRFVVTGSLLLSAALIGYYSYTTLSKNEAHYAASQYRSIATQALSTTLGKFGRSTNGTRVFATSYTGVFPNSTSFPNVVLPGYYEIAADLMPVSNLDNIGYFAIVKPDQLPTFEPFMLNYFYTEDHIPKPLPPPAAYGIVWSMSPSGPYHDTTGTVYQYETTNPNILGVLMPVTFSDDLQPVQLGYNSHSDSLVGPTLDSVIDCVRATSSVQAAKTSCGNRLTDIVIFPPLAPPENRSYYTFIAQPVVVEEDGGSGVPYLGGVVGGTVKWDHLLSGIVPEYVSGVECVVKSSTVTLTYAIVDGVATLRGVGDLHEDGVDKYEETIDLLLASGSVSNVGYKVSYYPTKKFFSEYESNNPVNVTIALLSIMMLCALLFAAYDIAISRESLRKELVLDTKRRFVRFISHEIRTPLNTVKLGLKLLEMEMEVMPGQVSRTSVAELGALVNSSVLEWLQLTNDILGNTESAVDVLNDLLNYDKIESGTMRLDYSSVHIWDLIKKTTASFVMQAKQKNIDLQLLGLSFGGSIAEEALEELYDRLRVVGDSARLAQVMRNLLSNALKFTPDNGTVTVTGKFIVLNLLPFTGVWE